MKEAVKSIEEEFKSILSNFVNFHVVGIRVSFPGNNQEPAHEDVIFRIVEKESKILKKMSSCINGMNWEICKHFMSKEDYSFYKKEGKITFDIEFCLANLTTLFRIIK